MIPVWLYFGTIALLLAAIAWCCWHNYKAHMEASVLAQCISDMLRSKNPVKAELIAERARQDLIRRGLWRSDK